MGSAPSSPALPAPTWRQHAAVRLFWNVGIAIGGVIIARLLGTVTQIVLARQMSLEDFGLYTSLYTLLGVVIILSSLGLDTWLLRQGASSTNLRLAINDTFSLRLYATITLMIVGIVALQIWPQPGMTVPLLVISGLGLTFELLLVTSQTALRAELRNHAAALVQVVAAACYILLLVLFARQGSSVFGATTYRLLAATLGIALLVWLMRSTLRPTWSPARFWQRLVEARMFFLSDILANIALKADLTMITLLIGTTAAALYAPALTIINTTFIVPAVASQVVLPVIARPGLPRRNLYMIVAASISGCLLYGLVCFGTFVFEARWIIHLIYQAKYDGAVPLLQIMALIPLMKSLNFCWVTLMVAFDRQTLRTKLQAVGSLANLFGNLVWIPLFGLIGAAWVNLATEGVLLVCYGYGAWVAWRNRP